MLSGVLQAAQLIPSRLRAAPGSLPLTLVSGYLGAGKTTLLNRLLSAPDGRRIAALVNDFGSINIDAALIRTRTEDMISLTNGCACCTVAGDLTRALIDLAQRPDPPDAIVLEASGLADPRSLAQVALANPALRLDGILTILDAETLHERAADPDRGATFERQLYAADLLVLNKLDLLDASRHGEARDWVRTRAPGTPLVESVNADLPADLVLGIGSTRLPSAAAPSSHADAFESWSAEDSAVLDAERARRWLESLPDSILRAKGLLRLSSDPLHATVFQRAGRRSRFERGPAWGTEEPRSQLVFIGARGSYDGARLHEGLQACRAP